jgi:hypothetical protein
MAERIMKYPGMFASMKSMTRKKSVRHMWGEVVAVRADARAQGSNYLLRMTSNHVEVAAGQRLADSSRCNDLKDESTCGEHCDVSVLIFIHCITIRALAVSIDELPSIEQRKTPRGQGKFFSTIPHPFVRPTHRR